MAGKTDHQWFILVDDEQRGPYDTDAIKVGITQGEFKPSDLAWRDGMADWLPVVTALKLDISEGGNAPPPPAPWERKPPEDISSKQDAPSVSTADKPRWYYRTWFIVVLLFFITPVGLVLLWLQKPRHRFLGNTITRILMSLLFGGGWLFGLAKQFSEGDPWVECEYTDDGGTLCSVGRDGGFGTKKVCWRIVEQCANGIKTQAKACQEVSGDSVATKYISPESFLNIDRCDEVTSVRIDNLVFGESAMAPSKKDTRSRDGAGASPAPVAGPPAVDIATEPPQVAPNLPPNDKRTQPNAVTEEAQLEPPQPEKPAVETAQNASLSNRPYVVIAASVKQSISNGQERAETAASKLRDAGFANAKVYDGRDFPNFKCCFWVVIVDAFETSAQAVELRDEVKNAGFECYVKNAFER